MIHQIWLGDKPRPHYMKDWNAKVWSEEDIRKMGLYNERLFNEYKEKGMYHGMSDIARIEILYNYGGFYIDADMELIKPLKDWKFLGFVCSWAYGEPVRVSNSVIGSPKNHPVFLDYIKRIHNKPSLEPWKTVGAIPMTESIFEYDIKPYPPHYFYPYNMRGEKMPNSHLAYARHHWGTTHNAY